MSAFIVISLKDSLHWIVDGIEECRPHNTAVLTCISTGKIIKKDEKCYIYEYSVFSKHNQGDNGRITNKEESETPANLFNNQIAQFLKVSNNTGEQFNVFLLDNPLSANDFQQSQWLMGELRSIYETHKCTNFQIVHVLFSYDVESPGNVNSHVPKMILENLLDQTGTNKISLPYKTLYVDNQNRYGSALSVDKEGHDRMMPRMLCDLMMLMSNEDDSYNTENATNAATGIFAVGYSECMYYHDDVFRYYYLAGERDLVEYLLKDVNDELSLDYEKYPAGLENRQKKLSKIYEEVSLKEDIDKFPDSIDKKINDIIIAFKDEVVSAKETAIVEAQKKDVELTKIARQNRLKELATQDFKENGEGIGEEPSVEISDTVQIPLDERKGCNLFARLFHKRTIEEPVDPRVADICITEESDKVGNEFPDFIDRKMIYDDYSTSIEDDEERNESLRCNEAAYRKLLSFIQSKVFIEYLKSKYTDKSTLKDLIGRIKSIADYYAQRQDYLRLQGRIKELSELLKKKNAELKDFKLTSHCTSVENLIDFEKLRDYFSSTKKERCERVLAKWNERKERELLSEILTENIKWELLDFYYVKWNRPFAFINNLENDVDLKRVCDGLMTQSVPFVNIYSLPAIAVNMTYSFFYTDNKNWTERIQNDNIGLKNINIIYSTHICSKICMFQFLPMDYEMVNGLVDCMNEENE
ncbi:MAG: hypothetical protein NC115_05340 [Bacteroidales bacterium]|nr:hypothetical protein [Bacteroidales bacterium]